MVEVLTTPVHYGMSAINLPCDAYMYCFFACSILLFNMRILWGMCEGRIIFLLSAQHVVLNVIRTIIRLSFPPPLFRYLLEHR